MTGARIPLGDAAALARQLRRTRLVRLGFAAAVTAVAAVALAQALSLRSPGGRLLPSTDAGIVVFDVSSSITVDRYKQILATVDELGTSERRFGLVLFSDTAYEALPPGTRASAVRRMRRFFRPVRPGETRDRTRRLVFSRTEFPSNPWTTSFSAGTQISSALLLARAILERDRLENGSVVLVSDLATDQSDIARLENAVTTYLEEGIPLKVVALSPAETDRAMFQEMLRGGGRVLDPPRATDEQLRRAPEPVRSAFPMGYAAAAAVLLLLLAANELWCGRLVWRRA